MDFFKKYTTPFGGVSDGEKIDAYGIDHSGFPPVTNRNINLPVRREKTNWRIS